MSSDLEAARRDLTERLMGRPGVSGTAVGEISGKPCLVVYLEESSATGGIPRRVRGFPVKVEKAGRFKAF